MPIKNFVPLLYFAALFTVNSVAAENDQRSLSAWEGHYIGFTTGVSSANADPTVNAKAKGYFITTDPGQTDPQASRDLEATNVTGSLFWGLNRQIGNKVYGLEVDLSLTDYNEQYTSGNISYLTAPASTFSVVTNVKSDWAVGLRARLGYIREKSLFYVSAGPSIRQFKYDFTFTDTFHPQLINVNESKWNLGWTVGLGYEMKLPSTWSLKTELLHSSYKDIVDAQSTTIGYPNDGFTHKLDFTEQSLRIGLYRKF